MGFKLFDWSLKLKGFPMEKSNLEFQHILNIPASEFADYIENKKEEIVKFHLKNNSYYLNFFNNATYTTWESVPIMIKKDFQRPLVERLSDGYTPKSVYVNKTSGSSGDPFVFAKDKEAHALTWASIIHRFGWFGVDFNSSY